MSESITITIKSSGDKKYELTFDPTITVAELKNLVAEKAEIPAASQRLIYSGKVLKDGETVASYKVQNGHTIHLVRSAGAGSSSGAAAASPSTANASTTAANTSSTAPPNTANASSVPSNIAAGQGSFNPLADLTGARYAGYSQLPSASMFGPDGGMNSNLPDPDQLNSMMSNPMFQQQMQAMLSDPQMLDFMIQQNPQLRAMGPQVREMLQSPFFRQMISNPQMMRSMMEMNRGNAAAQSAFPAPGANPAATGDAAAGENATTGDNANANAGAAGAGAAAANPFAGLFPNGVPPIDPSALFGGAAPAAPVDNRPPEERYENQLRQLNDMGFYDFDRNVEALRRTGGSVQGAIEYLLGGN